MQPCVFISNTYRDFSKDQAQALLRQEAGGGKTEEAEIGGGTPGQGIAGSPRG